jgi:YHS domain-containing protein
MDKDPVCGMAVSRKDMGGRSEYQQKTYFFCSERCKQRFDSDPESYVLRRLADDGRRRERASGE